MIVAASYQTDNRKLNEKINYSGGRHVGFGPIRRYGMDAHANSSRTNATRASRLLF